LYADLWEIPAILVNILLKLKANSNREADNGTVFQRTILVRHLAMRQQLVQNPPLVTQPSPSSAVAVVSHVQLFAASHQATRDRRQPPVYPVVASVR